MLQYLQTTQLQLCAYVSENVPPSRDFQLALSEAWQWIRPWIKEPMQVDATTISSCAHCFRWLWTNLAPPKVF